MNLGRYAKHSKSATEGQILPDPTYMLSEVVQLKEQEWNCDPCPLPLGIWREYKTGSKSFIKIKYQKRNPLHLKSVPDYEFSSILLFWA